MKNSIISVGLFLCVLTPNSAIAFDYIKQIEECALQDVKTYFISEAKETKEFYQDGETHLEARRNIALIRWQLKEGILSRAEANELIQWEHEDIEYFDQMINKDYEEEMRLLKSTTTIAICIFKHYLRSVAYETPSLMSKLISGSPSSNSSTLIEKYGADRYQLALALKWYCEKFKTSQCYFNYGYIK